MTKAAWKASAGRSEVGSARVRGGSGLWVRATRRRSETSASSVSVCGAVGVRLPAACWPVAPLSALIVYRM